MKGVRVIFVSLLLMVVASSFAVIHARHQSRLLFVELGGQKQQRDQLDIRFGQLQLERSAWATHGRVERVARDKLDMKMPSQQSVVLIRQ